MWKSRLASADVISRTVIKQNGHTLIHHFINMHGDLRWEKTVCLSLVCVFASCRPNKFTLWGRHLSKGRMTDLQGLLTQLCSTKSQTMSTALTVAEKWYETLRRWKCQKQGFYQQNGWMNMEMHLMVSSVASIVIGTRFFISFFKTLNHLA